MALFSRAGARSSSIRARLILLLAVLAGPFVALQVWYSYREYSLNAEHGERTAVTLAEATAVSAEQFLLTVEGAMVRTADYWGDQLLDPEPCEEVVDGVVIAFGFLVNAIAVDGDGRIVCSSMEPGPDGPLDVVGRDWFEEARRTGRFAVGEPIEGRITRRWVVAVAAPILGEDGGFRGTLAGSVELARLQDLLARIDLPADELLTLYTQEGTVLARSRDPEQWVGKTLPPDTTEARPMAGGLVTETLDLDGELRIFGRVDVPRVGWRVSVGLPAGQVRGPAMAAMVRRGGIGVLWLAVALALGWGIYRSIAGSLRQLREGVRSASLGSRVRVPDDTPQEVREVADRLNETLERTAAAERAERVAKDRYRSVFENAVFGIYVSTLDGQFVEVNPSLVRMLGYDSREQLQAVGITALYPDPSRRSALIELHGFDNPIRDREVTWVRRDGTPIQVRLNGAAVRLESGESAYEMIVEDITEERRREAEQRQRQKMEAMGRLAGGIAHDFNNLLTVISGGAEIIAEAVAADSELTEEVEEVRNAAERASRLTRQLLAFSRKTPAEARALDLNEVIEHLEAMLRRLIDASITLETELGASLYRVQIDRGQVEQVVMNLVINARDALPDGGTITVATTNVPREDPLDEDRVLLSVTDDGIGMDADTVESIFEPFFTTKTKERGTGLGLSNVYGIVRQAGGTVRVESAPGEGSRFEILLPAADGMPLPVPEIVARSAGRDVRAPAIPADGGRGTVLVVEDKKAVRNLVRRVLEGEGYTVDEAADGVDALDRIDVERPPALVLTDVVMPRMRGPELASRLREILPRTPVLFMSGFHDDAELRRQLRGSPERFIAKPFTARELSDRVSRLLAGTD